MLIDEKMVQTEEDWYPCFRLETRSEAFVRARFYELRDKTFLVCVWGNDDFGVEQGFTGFSEAHECYKKITPLITQEELCELGFVSA